MEIIHRDAPPRAVWALCEAGVHPLLARLFAARGVRSMDELDDGLARLLAPETLQGAAAAARLLADAIAAGSRISIVADYDCDGATACAVGLRGLALLGAAPGSLHYVVPDRALHGYGLTPAIVDLALGAAPRLLITVDNGIASLAGVAHARRCGLDVLVTDHHLPALEGGKAVLPDASVVVNPNQPGCTFESKHLAGVGVMFYVLLALRGELRARGVYGQATQPRLDGLLDLVALGTVADVVRLDANNRRLVAQGLHRIRKGRMQAGVAALFAVAGRDAKHASAFDFGFALGPRVNAAGRLSDMRLGIELLLTDNAERAHQLAQQLDAINRERRELEAGMNEQALALLDRLQLVGAPPAVALHDPAFHEGVVGIVASRLKERLNRPCFVFASGRDGLLKGSGRSIEGFHLRDALDLICKREPDLLQKFGGHAMAAGCTILAADLSRFGAALAAVALEWIEPAHLARRLVADGPLEAEWFEPRSVQRLNMQVWGPGFAAPLFCDEVEVVAQRLVGDKHLKLKLRHGGALREAVWFGRSDPLPGRARLAYRLSLDSYEGIERVQMVIEAMA